MRGRVLRGPYLKPRWREAYSRLNEIRQRSVYRAGNIPEMIEIEILNSLEKSILELLPLSETDTIELLQVRLETEGFQTQLSRLLTFAQEHSAVDTPPS